MSSTAVSSDAGSPDPSAGTTYLDARYGRTPERRRRSRRWAVAAASAFLVVLAAWVIWGGIDGATGEVEVLDTAYEVIDEHQVSVSWQITVDVGNPAKCAVQAQNTLHGIVGWKIVDIPESDVRTRVFTETVNTSELAVTGLIYRCWLA